MKHPQHHIFTKSFYTKTSNGETLSRLTNNSIDNVFVESKASFFTLCALIMREHAKLVDLITSSRRPTVITRTSGCIHQQRLVDARGSEGRYTIAIEEEVSRVPRNEFEPSTDSP